MFLLKAKAMATEGCELALRNRTVVKQDQIYHHICTVIQSGKIKHAELATPIASKLIAPSDDIT